MGILLSLKTCLHCVLTFLADKRMYNELQKLKLTLVYCNKKMMDVNCTRMYCKHQKEITNYKDHTNSSNNQVNFLFHACPSKMSIPFFKQFLKAMHSVKMCYPK